LKDASASAIYGARGAFGVILVETKKGKGKLKVSLGTEFSLGKPIMNVDMVDDPYIWMTELNKQCLRTYNFPYYPQQDVENAKAWVEDPTFENEWKVVNGILQYYGNSDYQGRLIADFMPQEKYDMTVSGGSENASYYVSFGYLNKKGWIKDKEKNEDFKRYNILMKSDFKIYDWLSIDEEIVFNSQVSDKPHFYHHNVNINSVARYGPNTKPPFPDLEYYLEPGDHDKYKDYIGMDFRWSMMPYLKQGGRETFTISDIWLNQGITLNPVKGLKIRSKFSYQKYYRTDQDVHSMVDMVNNNLSSTEMILHGFSEPDWMSNSNDYNQYYAFNSYGEYIMEQFSDHYLKGMIGFNQEWAYNTSVGARANDLVIPTITDLDATTGIQQVSGGKSNYALRGMFYRLNYIFKNKYLLESSGRYDLTSRFSKDSRAGFFPSFSAGWRISNESFMSGAKRWIDNLKLRGSYGELGNQMVSNYAYISSMGSGTSPYIMSTGEINYISPGGLVSSNLTWEKTVTTNFGFDLSILDQRLDLSADIYTRDTKDMLMNVSYPELLGTGTPKENAADLRTKGWELSFTWRDKLRVGSEMLGYGINLSLSDNQAEITKYENPTGAFSDYYVGKKIGEIWGFETVGIFQYDEDVAEAPSQIKIGSNWQAGDMQYADLNGDGEISYGSNTLNDPGDQKILGNTTARYSFGINPDINYKNWTLNVFFQGLFRDFLPSTEAWGAFYPGNTAGVQKSDVTDSWSEDNREAYFPAPHFSFGDRKNVLPQSRWVQNAAYIRLKNLMLNYNLPLDLVNKIGMKRAQIYFSGMDLWEYTKMRKPLDPESIFTTYQEYWRQRRYTLGIKITF
jgi:TonB-linked SusC/RagA family outer membrane protein